MNFVKIIAVLLSVSLVVTGCQNVKRTFGKRNNGSLNYQSAQKLPPLKLPANQATADFTQLYPTPNVGQNTLNLTNESGKQYQLPAPPKSVQ